MIEQSYDVHKGCRSAKPSHRETKTTIQVPSLEDFVMHAELDIGDRWQWYCDRFVARLRRRGKR